MLPLRDINRALATPHVNRMLIMINVLISVVMFLSSLGVVGEGFTGDVYDRFAMVPQDIINGGRVYTLFTSMFLHAGLFHLFGNMLYLYVFGDNVEGAFGHLSYLVFYVVCGLAASLAHILSITSPDLYSIPVVGASGAISGILGAYLVLYPKARILTVILYGLPIIVPVPAILFLGFWFLMQWLLGVYDIIVISDSGGVAYWAHVGGFIAGVVIALIFGLRRKRSREKRFHVVR